MKFMLYLWATWSAVDVSIAVGLPMFLWTLKRYW